MSQQKQSVNHNAHLQEMKERKLFFGDNYLLNNKPQKFETNFVKTSKYNVITFLPKSLMLQFQKYANWYFLFTAIMQCFPIISTQNPVSAVAPLAFVIMLSMLREAIEDVKRHKSDTQMNSSSCVIWRNNQWSVMKWADVFVGDIIFAKEEEIIASDAIILCSSLSTGQSFIETSSLDGEKNLKPRQSIPELQNKIFPLVNEVPFEKHTLPKEYNGYVTCSMPNPHLHFFEGCIVFDNEPNKKHSVNVKNLLLRGSRIKNVEWAIGLVVYTGQDTKIMKNADQGKNKMSTIDRKCNTQNIIYIHIFQFIIIFYDDILFELIKYFAIVMGSRLYFLRFLVSSIKLQTSMFGSGIQMIKILQQQREQQQILQTQFIKIQFLTFLFQIEQVNNLPQNKYFQ